MKVKCGLCHRRLKSTSDKFEVYADEIYCNRCVIKMIEHSTNCGNFIISYPNRDWHYSSDEVSDSYSNNQTSSKSDIESD